MWHRLNFKVWRPLLSAPTVPLACPHSSTRRTYTYLPLCPNDCYVPWRQQLSHIPYYPAISIPFCRRANWWPERVSGLSSEAQLWWQVGQTVRGLAFSWVRVFFPSLPPHPMVTLGNISQNTHVKVMGLLPNEFTDTPLTTEMAPGNYN